MHRACNRRSGGSHLKRDVEYVDQQNDGCMYLAYQMIQMFQVIAKFL